MRTTARNRASALAAASAVWAAPAAAQETTETSSYGERYESEEIVEFGNGSTIYSVNINTDINGEQVTIAGLSRYFVAYGQGEVEQAVPGSFSYMYQGVPVTVNGWSTPQLTDSWYEVIDVFTEDSYTSQVVDLTTVQTTSGDGPDAVVPIGSRGFCGDDGASGATNYGALDGAFAQCDYAEDYVTVAPGTVNANTHTTTVYRDIHYHFESIDDGYTDIYLVTPTASATASSGTMERTVATTTTVRTDSHATQLTGVIGNETLFDETLDGTIGSAGVQSALATLARPQGHAAGGAPAVVVWSAPVLTGSSEQLTASSSETESDTQSYEVVTVTETLGGAVNIGDLGVCTSTGTSGTTTGAAPTGSFAECQGGVSYVLSSGEANTNTHTTYVTETTVDTLVTENWLSTEAYRLTGTPVLVGQIHAAVRDALFDGAGGFARQHGDALAARGGLGFALWADVFTGKATRDGDSAGPGSAHSGDGVAGGASFHLSGIASLGVAVSYESTDSALAGLPESADLSHTQVGVAAELSPGAWRLVASAGRGWADIDTERGGDAIGGVARASYDAATWFATLEAGPEFGLGLVTLRPLAGLEWSKATLGEFAENGGIALAGGDDSASRLAATLGAQVSSRWNLPGGPGVGLWADVRGGQVLDGKGRSRAVVFADDPDDLLRVTSASEGGTYAEGRAGVSLFVAGGLGLHLGGEGRVGGGHDDWRASAGVSAAF
jgi:uncharacterized protein with beta-barrel porin domain